MPRTALPPLLAMVLIAAACGLRQTTYQPMTERGQQCMQACRERYETCQVACFASTGCLETCIGQRNGCFAACPDVRPVEE